jgi:hypothetical protein
MSFALSPPSPESRARLHEMMAPVPTEPIGAQVCPAGSVPDIAYHEYRESLGRLLSHIRSYDERIHGALQVDLRADYEERWRHYQRCAMEHVSAAEQSQEDADYAAELTLRNTLISKRRDDIVIFVASFDRDVAWATGAWFNHLESLISAEQKEWSEMSEMIWMRGEEDDE